MSAEVVRRGSGGVMQARACLLRVRLPARLLGCSGIGTGCGGY